MDNSCYLSTYQLCFLNPFIFLLWPTVPPDDEGWLCPGCDCKVDCIELLNDCQGTNISISDSWEVTDVVSDLVHLLLTKSTNSLILLFLSHSSHLQKVFPEAAAAGQNSDQNIGLPSDDSDDNDYDPDEPEIDKKSEGDESSSDESDFTSASDELEASPGDKQNLGIPFDDSEDGDDDYDPDGPDIDENVKEESSSSDFTSDSEDLAAYLDDKELSREVESPGSSGPQGGVVREGSKHGGKKMQSLHGELLSILELNPRQDGGTPVSGKRNVERLNYKKLYDVSFFSSSILIEVL